MRITAGLLCIFLVFAAIIVPSVALEPSGLQKKELVLLVEDINRAIANDDIEPLADAMPPRLYDEMARLMQADRQMLQDSFKEQLRQQFATEFGAYKFDSGHIDYLQAADGTFYALVPTQLETKEMVVTFKTLALYENTKWYLIQGGQKTVQNTVFLEIYPFLENINIPLPETMKK